MIYIYGTGWWKIGEDELKIYVGIFLRMGRKCVSMLNRANIFAIFYQCKN